MPRVRVHQHVNPFAPHYQQAPESIDLTEIFASPTLPLHLDIGCARGRFILKMAEAEPQWNYLGVEIREPLVTEANEIAVERGLGNLHYKFCNATIGLGALLNGLPKDQLQAVTIQFPDPWFKKRHAKRRMVNPELVEAVLEKLAARGRIFVPRDASPAGEILAIEQLAICPRQQRAETEQSQDIAKGNNNLIIISDD